MPSISALRRARPGRVLVELDGLAWRVLPAEVVARAGLRVGLGLDRACLRELRRELRRSEALASAVRVLRHRDVSTSRLGERVERAGVAPAAWNEALATLHDAGVVNDGRFARGRAAALAGRDAGDAAIRFDLERQGLDDELIEEALGALEPEHERAKRVVGVRGGGAGTARHLGRRGFAEESIEAALGGLVAEEP